MAVLTLLFFPKCSKAESAVLARDLGIKGSFIHSLVIKDVKADKMKNFDYLQALRYNRGALDLACMPTADRQLCNDSLFVVIKQSRHPALEFKDRTPNLNRSSQFIRLILR